MTLRRSFWIQWLIFGWGIACLAAQAPPNIAGPADSMIVTANAEPVPYRNLSRTVRVITREEIRALPVQSVADVLRYALGVDVRSRGSHGVQSDFSIRGSTFNQVLVLLDGVRLNSSQTGHHNADFPVALESIERVEVLYGPGSSLHGGDALAGTVNLITRGSGSREWSASGGQFGLARGSALWSFSEQGPLEQVALWGERSTGFTPTRDFRNWGVRLGGRLTENSAYSFSHVDKSFGAENFYGPSPSREWTEATLLSLRHQRNWSSDWDLELQAAWRRHGDRFLWDENRPGFAENIHGEDAIQGGLRLHHKVSAATQMTVGADFSSDWIDSSNLGRRDYQRGSTFVEIRQSFGQNFMLYPGLRVDGYSDFGSAWSPSLSGSLWLNSQLKLRSSVGRAFRVPTFTERFYQDPNHQARSDLSPERSFGVEGGLDWYPIPSAEVSLTLFRRSEADAIDWVRESTRERWWTTNIHEVRTKGAEIGVTHRIGEASHLRWNYAYLDSDLGSTDRLFKYSLEYPRHAFSLVPTLALPEQVIFGGRISYRSKIDGRRYWIVDARLLRRWGRIEASLTATNLFNRRYEEIRGVEMPPRWIEMGLRFYFE